MIIFNRRQVPELLRFIRMSIKVKDTPLIQGIHVIDGAVYYTNTKFVLRIKIEGKKLMDKTHMYDDILRFEKKGKAITTHTIEEIPNCELLFPEIKRIFEKHEKPSKRGNTTLEMSTDDYTRISNFMALAFKDTRNKSGKIKIVPSKTKNVYILTNSAHTGWKMVYFDK